MTESKLRIDVSADLIAFVGQGVVAHEGWPNDSLVVSFAGLEREAVAVLRFDPHSDGALGTTAEVVLVVQRDACRRLFGGLPANAGHWYLPSRLRDLVRSILDCDTAPGARSTLQGARSVDLLCQAFAELAKGELVPVEGGGLLNELDAARIAAARRMIDEKWQEKLTLEAIARACGINRDKLSRGFRTIYNSTVADILTENRLSGARRLLLASDLPVATVGYRCGYLNNASFTRAFTRRYGLSPSQLRQRGEIAA
ncbi:helix-turn-helix transcriptional regulator [Novosphingobium sp. PS1R-30]|uniref:Helix-turn-helix transcriptional regulator n=1 Tax=Novosphingobium anseongense TaxID=3133436 RepID=A0ABU8RZJ3_9SPHN